MPVAQTLRKIRKKMLEFFYLRYFEVHEVHFVMRYIIEVHLRYITKYGMASDVIERFDWLIAVERKLGGKMIVEFQKWSMVTSKWKQLVRRYTRRK